jgi:hypothetical protein
MNTTRVQLPDGRLLTIEGGTAETTAALLRNHYLTPAATQEREALATNEEPMTMPSLQDALQNQQHQRIRTVVQNLPRPVVNETDEQPLEMPRMKFSE